MAHRISNSSYVVVDHARRGSSGLDAFYKLVAPRYRHRRIALFSAELRMLHHLRVRSSRTGLSETSSTTQMLLTVHRDGGTETSSAPLGPVVGSAILLSPGGLLCTDLDPTDPGLASAVAAYLYDRLSVDRVAASAKTKSPGASTLDQRMLLGLLPAMSGEAGATAVMAAAWGSRTGLSSRVMSAQQVLELTPQGARGATWSSPGISGHAELSGSAASTDDALQALIQDYVNRGPSFRTAADLPQLMGVLPADSVSIQEVLNRLAGDSRTVPVGEVFARSSRDLGDRTVLWVADTQTGARYPVAMAHLTYPVESVIRIGPIHAASVGTLTSLSAAQEADLPISAAHPALRGRENGYLTLLPDSTGIPAMYGKDGERLRKMYKSVVVREAARLALRAGAKHIVIHTPMDSPDETTTYHQMGFASAGSLVRLAFSPEGTVPLH